MSATNVVQAIPDAIRETINVLAESFGTTAEYVYVILVRQQYVEATITTLLFVAALGMFAWCFRSALKWWKELAVNSARPRETRQDEDVIAGHAIPWSIAAGIFGIATITRFCIFANDIGKFINPEYYAIKHVMALVGAN